MYKAKILPFIVDWMDAQGIATKTMHDKKSAANIRQY